MRLFAAIDLPSDERERLREWLTAARLEATDLRLTPADQWHVTLAFYGEVPGGVVDELADRLRRGVARTPALSVQIAGVGSFPADPGRARVLWLGVDGDLTPLTRLSERCTAAGRRCGLAMEDRKYRAHLTLARARRDTVDLRPTLAALPRPDGEPWRVTTVRLFRSTLGPPVRHDVIEEFPLDA